MAAYFGMVQGNRKAISRCGTVNSGMKVKANSWRMGIEAELKFKLGTEYMTIWLTKGSGSDKRLLFELPFTDIQDYVNNGAFGSLKVEDSVENVLKQIVKEMKSNVSVNF